MSCLPHLRLQLQSAATSRQAPSCFMDSANRYLDHRDLHVIVHACSQHVVLAIATCFVVILTSDIDVALELMNIQVNVTHVGFGPGTMAMGMRLHSAMAP